MTFSHPERKVEFSLYTLKINNIDRISIFSLQINKIAKLQDKYIDE